MNKSTWWKALLWMALILLPGTMLLVPVALLLLSRHRQARPQYAVVQASPDPQSSDVTDATPSEASIAAYS